MKDEVIIAALIGAAFGYWYAKRQACACKQQQQATVSDPMAWLGQWQA